MIDESTKNDILESMIRVLGDWTKEQMFVEPRERWFRTGKATINKKTHVILSIMVGKDEQETWQILDDLIKIEDKYTAGQKDINLEEDFRKKVYQF